MERLVPYRFGAPVDRPWFCDREAELDVLCNRMRAGIHLIVLSPRRYGKTSLLLRAADTLERDGVHSAYANLLLATTEVELASIILQAVVRSVLGPVARRRHSLEDALRHLRITPKVSIGADGAVSLGLDPATVGTSWIDVITDAIALLERASERRSAVLIFDEFQVVAGIGRRGAGGVFKALADAARRTSLVFSGSHLAIMEQLTKGSGAPLHGMGERVVLDVVPEDPMVGYLQRRARSAGKTLTKKVAQEIYAQADTVPNYVQQLAQAALEAADAVTITATHVAAGFDAIVERQSAIYAQQYEDLGGAPAQQRILRTLAHTPTASVYAKGFLDAVQVANANAVTTALRVLDNRELVVRRGRTWHVADPFLRRWLTAHSPTI
ncbi:MAG: hypothetical protein M0029_01680 [Actinomycetota bacterium]|jgi:hypothetical protein|nr:hypothetical protein [Actinomycetota bacterium]MDA8279369.1 hypothetical protein [Actinomycetota bacterium]